MLPKKRQMEIKRLLDERGSVTITELTSILGASESTVRRDLDELGRQGAANRVFGGATAVTTGVYMANDDSLINRRSLAVEEKLRIAKYAASLVVPDDFVYIDAGSTTELMVDFLPGIDVGFVTNAISVAQRLADRGFEVQLLGGLLKPVTGAVVGSQATEALKMYNFTKGFFGVNGISRKDGFSTPDVIESLVKREALKHCSRRYVLADASKFNQRAPGRFWEFDDAIIITSTVPDNSYKNCINITEVDNL